MPELDATLEQSASETEQPDNVEAVESSEAVGTDPVVEETTEETPAPRLYAGKYKTVEELESAYRNTSSEASRMSQQLAAKPAAEPAKAEPSQTELEDWKEGHLNQVAKFQAAAIKAQSDGDYAKAQQLEAQAAASARQIRLIDAELRKKEIASYTQSTTKKAAAERIINESRSVLTQYADELRPGTELHTKASTFMAAYEAMGHDPNDPLVQAQAVSMAAQVLGLSSKKVEQSTRKELTKNIQNALKAGVVTAGGGKAGKTAGAPDFLKMTDAQFRAYKAQHGMGD